MRKRIKGHSRATYDIIYLKYERILTKGGLFLKGKLLTILFGTMLVLVACGGEKESDSINNSGTSDTVNVSACRKDL